MDMVVVKCIFVVPIVLLLALFLGAIESEFVNNIHRKFGGKYFQPEPFAGIKTVGVVVLVHLILALWLFCGIYSFVPEWLPNWLLP